MTERKKGLLMIAILTAVMIGMFSPILFTSKIIRAPDILNEYYWSVKDLHNIPLVGQLKVNLSPGWSLYLNSGYTTEGGDLSLQFLKYHNLIYWLFPSPSNVAWFIVLHLLWGGIGTYLYCRVIGASRFAALMGGIIFAVATENASLINAGHVLKIATISYAPFAFCMLEKGFQSRRLIFFMAAAFTLAFQFFNYHWQIAYYTCLGMAIYGAIRFAGIAMNKKRGQGEIPKLLGMNLVLLVFFLTTVSISLLPLANWAKDTNRGVQSGANQGKGGLEREEAMSWSMPPEEMVTFAIPGFFGFSRRESGENPKNISSYYWGRMHFTQTSDYMGLLPWLLLPLPLIFRRDRITWIAVFAVAGGIIFSMGRYTVVYNLLFDYFPGINRFRVPKMMLFLTTLGLAVFTARGVDLLMDEEIPKKKEFARYLAGVVGLPLVMLIFFAILKAGQNHWLVAFVEFLSQPTRYEQGPELVFQRWNTILAETLIAFAVASVYAAVFFVYYKKWISGRTLPLLLMFILLCDLGRVNAKFMFTTDVPSKSRGIVTPVMEFLKKESNQYRVLPMNSDPQQFSNALIPTMYYSMPVQQTRWQDILDNFSFNSAIPDMLNVKYVIYSMDQFQQQKGALPEKLVPVFQSPDGSEVVLQNRQVLPKAWIVTATMVAKDRAQILNILLNPLFNPRMFAVVDSAPPLPLAGGSPPSATAGRVSVDSYENNKITISEEAPSPSLLVLGEKYYNGWKALVDGKKADIYPVNYILRGVYLTPGKHRIEFVFDPLPFKIGKYLTLASFAMFAAMLARECFLRRRSRVEEG